MAAATKRSSDEQLSLEVEDEKEDLIEAPKGGQITKPFDPELIKVRTDKKTVDLLIRRIDHAEIGLAPEFQRLARIWDGGRKGRLIESILLRIPLPVFYVASNESDKWDVVDGLQRLTTIHDFVKNNFALQGLEYLPLDGETFSTLPRNMQRRIEETELVINIIEFGTPAEVMINIFKRINTEGMTLNGQEIRHALNRGPIRNLLKELAESKEFRAATDNSIKDTRMLDRECVLRFLAFSNTSPKDYQTNDLDGFLSGAMQRLNKMPPGILERLKADFLKAMRAAHSIFGNDAFRKRTEAGAPRNPINKALFEAWSVNLAKLSDNDLDVLILRKERLKRGFMELLNSDRFFETSISYSTGDPPRVMKRFEGIRQLILGALV